MRCLEILRFKRQARTSQHNRNTFFIGKATHRSSPRSPGPPLLAVYCAPDPAAGTCLTFQFAVYWAALGREDSSAESDSNRRSFSRYNSAPEAGEIYIQVFGGRVQNKATLESHRHLTPSRDAHGNCQLWHHPVPLQHPYLLQALHLLCLRLLALLRMMYVMQLAVGTRSGARSLPSPPRMDENGRLRSSCRRRRGVQVLAALMLSAGTPRCSQDTVQSSQ